MSHFSSMRCKLTDKEVLKATLQSFPCIKQVKENSYTRGYSGKTAAADLVAVLEGEYDLGFRFIGDEYSVAEADFGMGICGGGDKTLKDLWQEIVGKYAVNIAQKNASKVGSSANVSVCAL